MVNGKKMQHVSKNWKKETEDFSVWRVCRNRTNYNRFIFFRITSMFQNTSRPSSPTLHVVVHSYHTK